MDKWTEFMEVVTNKFRFAYPTVLLALFIGTTGFNSYKPANRLLGIWESEEKNLHIEMFEEDDHIAGRMVWFLCTSGESMMCTYLDTENPDPKLTTRTLIGLKVVERISYQGNNIWGSGKIYDPNTGRTYDAHISLIDPNKVVVRGYWKFRWLGRSIVFNRLVSP
jgi:uncharacterized protein (DUF2147 family)